MQMSSSRFIRRARLCSAFALASLVFAILSLAGCGGSTTGEQNCTRIASVTGPNASSGVLSHTDGAHPSSTSALKASLSARQALSAGVPRTQYTQYRLGFWEQGIIAVAVVADPSGHLPTQAEVAHALLSSLPPSLSVSLDLPAKFPSMVQHAEGSTAETVFLQLQKSGTNDIEDDDLKKVINAINQKIQSSGIFLSGPSAIAGASPDWIMVGGTGGDFIGGHPGGPPTQLNSASRCPPTNSSLGADKNIYVLDTADPLAPIGSTTPGNGAGHTGGTGSVASILCPPPPTPACQLVNDLGMSVDEVDALLPDETAYMKAYHAMSNGNDKTFREHGLFVSAIIQHVAPKANIHLRRVLNDQGVGDMATLLDALTKVPKGSIVNLSLAVEPPPSCLIAIWESSDKYPRGDTSSMADYSYTKPDGSIDPSKCNQNPLVNTSDPNAPSAPLYDNQLFVPLGIGVADTATRATIVAAAGNDATSGPDMPAAFCGVTAVGAVDANGNPAPFSNKLQGQCLSFPTSLSALSALGNNSQAVGYGGTVTGATALGVGVCSLYAASASGTGAATWDGTSFATAFVSGQKAGGNNPGQPCK